MSRGGYHNLWRGKISIRELIGKKKKWIERKLRRTVILAVPPDAEAPCLDGGKAEPDGFTQSGCVDMRDTVLVTYSAV